MEIEKALPGAENTAPETIIWIHVDGQSQPHKHVVNGECECPTCASKIRYIILPYAA